MPTGERVLGGNNCFEIAADSACRQASPVWAVAAAVSRRGTTTIIMAEDDVLQEQGQNLISSAFFFSNQGVQSCSPVEPAPRRYLTISIR